MQAGLGEEGDEGEASLLPVEVVGGAELHGSFDGCGGEDAWATTS